MQFRMATTGDVETLASLRMQMLREVASVIPPALHNAVLKYLEKHIADKTCLCALGEEDGNIVVKAMLCVSEAMPDEMNVSGKYARLFSVCTVPAFRGKGYMEKLLMFLLDEAKNNGIEEVFASAEEKAMPLYKRIGFSVSETEMHIKLL